MIGVSIPLWSDQFFLFAVLEFSLFLGVLPATKLKLNLQEAWLKVRCKSGILFLTELKVHLLNNIFSFCLRMFSPDCAPSG